MIPKDLTKDIIIRLKSIQGQVGGIIKMLDNNDDPEKITTQFKAVD
jgi:DNA-binding FrmR family transcriptional regulator